MKKISVLFFILILIMLLTYSYHSSATAANKERWEYKVINYNNSYRQIDKIMDNLNALGANGWELASIGSGSIVSDNMLYLKRRLP